MVSRRAININSTAILIALLAFSSLAQQASPQSEAPNSCDWNISGTLSKTRGERLISQSGKAKVEFFPVALRPVRSKCHFLSLASNGVKPLNKDSSFRIRNGELFSFDSWAPKPDFSPVTRTEPAAAVQAPQDSAAETQELAKKLSNPVASLISLPIQSNFDFGMGTGSGWRYTLNIQPVIPIALSPKWNMISRTIIPIIHQGNVTGPNTSQNGLGDILQSLFFSPNKSEPFIWGLGPAVLIPTATDSRLGAQKWAVGPTAVVIKQQKGWTYGVLGNHLWSVAGTSNRGDVSVTFLQPIVSYTNKQAWTYGLNTESTYDWKGHSWSIPINGSISKLIRFGKQPMSFGGGVKCWVTTPTGGPEGCGLRITVTALFPKK